METGMFVWTKSAKIIVVALCAMPSLNEAFAQCPPDTTPGVVASGGLEGSIISAVPGSSGRNVILTVQIRNTTEAIAHILTVGNYRVSSNNGASLSRADYGNTGFSFCRESSVDKDNPGLCLRKEGGDTDTFNEIASCKTIRGSINFFIDEGPDLKPGSTLTNYTYKAVVRFTKVNRDPLLADAPATPPRIVTLNFDPIPVH